MKIKYLQISICFLLTGLSFTYSQTISDTTQAYHFYLLAEQEYGNGDLPTSNRYYQKSGVLYKQADRYDKWAYCEYSRSYNYIELGAFDEAKKIARDALTIGERQEGLNYIYLVKLKKALGLAALREGHYQEARKYFTEALAVAIKHPREPYLATLYNDLGTASERENRLEDALRYFKLSAKSFKADDPRYIIIQSNISETLNKMGDHQQALEILYETLDIGKKNFGEDYRTLIPVYVNIGVVYTSLIDYDNALQYYEKALEICRKKFELYKPTLSAIYNNLGTIYNDREDFERAISCFEKAHAIDLEIYPKSHPNFTMYYNNEAHTYLFDPNKKDNTKSISLFWQAFHNAKSNHDEQQAAQALNNLANIKISQRHYDEGLTLIDKIFDSPSIQYVLPAEIASAWENKAIIHSELGNYALALEEINKAIATVIKNYKSRNIEDVPMLKDINVTPQVIDFLTLKAKYLEKIGEKTNDKKLLFAALHIYDSISTLEVKMQTVIQTRESKLKLNLKRENLFENAIALCFTLYHDTQDKEYLEKAFSFAEQSRAILLRESLRHKFALKFAAVPDSIVKRDQQIQALLEYYKHELATGDELNESDRAYFKNRIFELTVEYQALMKILAKQNPTFYKLKHDAKTISIHELQDAMAGDKEAIIRFFYGDSALYTFVITKDKAQLYVNKNSLQIGMMVEEVITGIKQQKYDMYIKNGFKLYKEIIEPLRLSKNIQSLFIIPDGKLYYLPFEVLLTQQPKNKNKDYHLLPYFLNTYTVQYHVSATLIHTAREQSNLQAAKKFASFAPVVVDSSFHEPALIYSENEALMAAQAMGGISFIKNKATETMFRECAERYSILHVATHTIVNDQNPLQSKLLFFPSGESSNDNMLFSYELYNLKIPARLVSLSACNTGMGKLERGEGVMSLARAFMYAGTSSILMSLWPVSDKTTESIMKSFYEELAKGENKDEALRQAKLNYLKNSDELSSDPFLWSSFIIIGDDKPLDDGENFFTKTSTLLLVSSLVLFLCYLVIKRYVLGK